MNKKIIASVIVFLGLIGIAIFIIAAYVVKSDNVQVRVAPREATIKIGDQAISADKPTYIKPGTYPLSITANGFTPLHKDIAITDNLKQFAYCLTPTNMTLEEYMSKNPDDRLICEAAGGQEYNETAKKVIDQYPIVRSLPYEDGTFLIGQGLADNGKDIVLTVHYSTEKSKNEALEWINRKAKGQTILPIKYYEDYRQDDRIGGVDSTIDKVLVKKYPIVKNLPMNVFIYKLGYRIDQSDDTGQSIVLTIESDTASGRVAALKNIRTLGYNPTDYKIEFINFESVLK